MVRSLSRVAGCKGGAARRFDAGSPPLCKTYRKAGEPYGPADVAMWQWYCDAAKEADQPALAEHAQHSEELLAAVRTLTNRN
jgi:hypothetical protein